MSEYNMVNELYWLFYYVIVIVMVEEMLINDDDVIERWLLLHIDVMLRVRNIREGMVS